MLEKISIFIFAVIYRDEYIRIGVIYSFQAIFNQVFGQKLIGWGHIVSAWVGINNFESLIPHTVNPAKIL